MPFNLQNLSRQIPTREKVNALCKVQNDGGTELIDTIDNNNWHDCTAYLPGLLPELPELQGFSFSLSWSPAPPPAAAGAVAPPPLTLDSSIVDREAFLSCFLRIMSQWGTEQQSIGSSLKSCTEIWGLISIITFDIYKLLEVLLFDFPESKIQFAMCFLCSSQGGSGSASWGDCGEYYCDSPELLLWSFYGAQPIILRLNCYSCQRSFANAFTICGETLL